MGSRRRLMDVSFRCMRDGDAWDEREPEQNVGLPVYHPAAASAFMRQRNECTTEFLGTRRGGESVAFHGRLVSHEERRWHVR